MTGPDDVSRETSTPWQRYQDRERTARDLYLTRVSRAHHVYLVGPYPDRDAYIVVERDAWVTYYAACRDAWHTCATALDTTAPPPPAPEPQSHPYPPAGLSVGSSAYWPTMRDVSPYPPAARESNPVFKNPVRGPDVLATWDDLEKQYGLICPECGIPWRQPSPSIRHRVNDVHPWQPAFTPITLGGQPVQIDPDQDRYQASDHRPESES